MHITHADVSTWRSGCLTLRGPLTSQKRGKQSFKESARLMSLIEITCDSLLYENSLQQSIVSHIFSLSLYVLFTCLSYIRICMYIYSLDYVYTEQDLEDIVSSSGWNAGRVAGNSSLDLLLFLSISKGCGPSSGSKLIFLGCKH